MSARLEKALSPAVNLIVNSIREELEEQGHVLTGKLSRSINVAVIQRLDTVCLEGTLLSYGQFVERGVKKQNIPFSPGSGKKTSKYIAGLVRFVKLRRLATNNKKALGIAFAIAKTHKKEGMPSRGSRRFSKNSKRRGFITFALKRNEEAIEAAIGNAFEGLIDIEIDNRILKGKT